MARFSLYFEYVGGKVVVARAWSRMENGQLWLFEHPARAKKLSRSKEYLEQTHWSNRSHGDSQGLEPPYVGDRLCLHSILYEQECKASLDSQEYSCGTQLAQDREV